MVDPVMPQFLIYIYIYVQVYIHTYIYKYTWAIYTYTYTHTHIANYSKVKCIVNVYLRIMFSLEEIYNSI